MAVMFQLLKLPLVNGTSAWQKQASRLWFANVSVSLSRGFQTGCSPGGGNSVRFRDRKQHGSSGHYSASSRVLLDKFVKHVFFDGSLVMRAPFTLKVKGSYFKQSNSIDRDRNKKMTSLYQQQQQQQQDSSEQQLPLALREIEESVPPSEFGSAGGSSESSEAGEGENKNATKDKEGLLPEKEAARREELEKLASIMSAQMSSMSQSIASEYPLGDGGAHDAMSGSCATDGDDEEKITSPVHVLLYGRPLHRIDTYSVVNPLGQQHSYVYLTDASSLEEADSMFDQQYHFTAVDDEAIVSSPNGLSSTAHISLWQPKSTSYIGGDDDPATETSSTNATTGDLFASAVKIFSPRHVIEAQDNGLKAVCLVPVCMNKIFLQADYSANIDLDGTLIDDLTQVGLTSEVGNIRVRDVTAEDITLASRLGDIACDGIVDGKISAETFGDGDFQAKGGGLYGNSLVVTTDEGDINLWAACHSNETYLATKRGNVHARDLRSASNQIVVQDAGNVNVNVAGGALNIVANSGSVFATVSSLNEDSAVHVGKGDVCISVPQKCNFRLCVSAPTISIAPRLLNTGELTLSKATGFEEFSNVDIQEALPTLNLSALQGSVTVQVIQTKEEQEIAFGYDSAN